MKIDYDGAKNIINIEKHGIGFDAVEDMDFDTALTVEDHRVDYGEGRFITMGRIKDRLHVMVWTMRDDVMRIISLRKANFKERLRYEKVRS